VRLSRLITRSLRFYWATGLAVALGVAVATAVITGSLVVGDSVKGSVRDTALARLGNVDSALLTSHFFRDKLADDLAKAAKGGKQAFIPVTIARAAARNPQANATVPNVSVIGIGGDFWRLFPGPPRPSLTGREVALNESAAGDLGVAAGQPVMLNVERRGKAPSDTLFTRRAREEVARSMRLTVAAVLPDDGVGGFSLGSQTATPRNVFVAKDWLARELGTEGLANAILAGSESHSIGRGDYPFRDELAAACRLDDYGLRLVPRAAQGYLSLQSDTLLLREPQVEAAREAAGALGGRAAAVSVYLATTIAKEGGGDLAYAVIAGVESLDGFPISPKDAAKLDDDGILLNTWAAAELDAKVGDKLAVSYFLPSRDGVYATKLNSFTLRGIVELSGPAADPGLVPDFEGITKARTIADWNPPFPVDLKRVTKRDEDYWEAHRATPKAYLSTRRMRSIWNAASPGGTADWVTSLRITGGTDVGQLQSQLSNEIRSRLGRAGGDMAFRPVRKQVLEGSKGSTDFGVLFVSMSMFLVVAAMGLAGTLMRLMAERRAGEAGMLLACGFTGGQAARAVLAEGAVLAVCGVAVGWPLGIAYAGGIINALNTGLLGTIGNAALRLHVEAASIAIGAVAGLAAGVASAWWGTRALGQARVLDLLAGWRAMGARPVRAAGKIAALLGVAAAIAAAAMIALGLAGAASPVAAFFAGGAALLAAALCGCYWALARAIGRRAGGRVSTWGLVVRNAAANRRRSMLAIGLFACATFVIVATAANRRDYAGSDVTRKDSGTGGFSLRAVASLPIRYDFGTKSGRARLGFSRDDDALFEQVKVYSFLMSQGDDVSCLNLAKPAFPRVLGVSRQFGSRGGFRVNGRDGKANAWETLFAAGRPGSAHESSPVPVFGDASSVQWQLHSGLGGIIGMQSASGEVVDLRVSGLVSNSIFASELLMSDENFGTLFPGQADARYFLIETPPGMEGKVAAALRRNLGDMGLEVRGTREILNSVIGVQNTYLSTFTALGGLGVVLGTFGLVAVLLRNALERRAEFALMLATGFSRKYLAALLVVENGGLLAAGLACGAAAALIAVAPQLRSAEAVVSWGILAGMLVAILLIGLAACTVAAASVVRGNLMEALREE